VALRKIFFSSSAPQRTILKQVLPEEIEF